MGRYRRGGVRLLKSPVATNAVDPVARSENPYLGSGRAEERGGITNLPQRVCAMAEEVADTGQGGGLDCHFTMPVLVDRGYHRFLPEQFSGGRRGVGYQWVGEAVNEAVLTV